MRLSKIVRSAITGGASLALALGLTACSRDYVVAYVYAISASNNTISAYAVDYQTGILNQVSGSPFQSTVSDPVKVVASPNNKYIYVIGGPNGSQGNSVEALAVGTDGKLYGQKTYNLSGTYPTGATIDSTGTFLYVTFKYQSGFTPASPGPGGVTIFPINTDGTLGTSSTLNVGNNPVAIAVSSPVCVPGAAVLVTANTSCTSADANSKYNVYAYVVDQEASPNATVLGFAQNMKTGALTPLSGTNMTTLRGVSAGVVPSAIAVDATARYVYVTDQETNQIYGYLINRTTNGNLTAMVSSPFTTGSFPVSIIIDPRAEYVYTANYNGNNVSSYTINQSTGALSAVAGSTFAAQAGVSCVTIEPALGQFLYTTNYVDGTLSGGKLNPNTGVVSAVANTPFPTASLPSCLVSVANGEHATSVVYP